MSLQTKSGAQHLPRRVASSSSRDDALDANDWFNNRAGRPRPDFSQHQFGGTLGGPLVRNRTFFFTDYQGMRIKQDLTLVSTVPSEAMRHGDFSELNRVIYDPRTGAPFPGNVIPPDRIDAVARRHHRAALSPAKHRGTTDVERADDRQLRDQSDAAPARQSVRRPDRSRFADANRAFARYSVQDAEREIPPSLPTWGRRAHSPGTYDIEAQSLAVNDTHVVRTAVGSTSFASAGARIDVGFVTFGFGQNTADAARHPRHQSRRTYERHGEHRVRHAGHAQPRVGGGTGTADMSALQLTDSVTHVRGRHTFKSGGEPDPSQAHRRTSRATLGLFAFNTERDVQLRGTVTGVHAGSQRAASRSPTSCSGTLPVFSIARCSRRRTPSGGRSGPPTCRTTFASATGSR